MLKTEMRNPDTMHIDRMTTEEMVAAIQRENLRCVEEVGKVQKQIAAAVDAVYEKMKNGGRLFYIGCGTSGRLGVLDASECPPTFGVSNDLVVGIIGGGDRALRYASEGIEDDEKRGIDDIAAYSLNSDDSVVGVSAAGGARYVLGALNYAKSLGCLTVGVSSNEDSELCKIADVCIAPDTGAEAVTGSTRMKAGTSQKLILNMISTSVMIKLGYVCENLMINLKPSNKKLRARCISIVSELLSCSTEEAERLLTENDWNIRATVDKHGEKRS